MTTNCSGPPHLRDIPLLFEMHLQALSEEQCFADMCLHWIIFIRSSGGTDGQDQITFVPRLMSFTLDFLSALKSASTAMTAYTVSSIATVYWFVHLIALKWPKWTTEHLLRNITSYPFCSGLKQFLRLYILRITKYCCINLIFIKETYELTLEKCGFSFIKNKNNVWSYNYLYV